jgi:hypothetical protein
MTDEIATANAEADTNSVDNTNISVTDFANRRLGQMQAQAESQEEEVQEVSEEVPRRQPRNRPKMFFHSWTWTICPRRS